MSQKNQTCLTCRNLELDIFYNLAPRCRRGRPFVRGSITDDNNCEVWELADCAKQEDQNEKNPAK